MFTPVALACLLIGSGINSASPQTPATEFTLDKAYRTQTIDALCKAINDRYVFPEVAKKMETDLRKRMAEGEFDTLESGADFAIRVNELLKSQVTDAHLRFRFSPDVLPVRKNPGQPSEDEIKRASEQSRVSNAGFEAVERLPGNIGYVRFNYFDDPSEMKRPTAAVFRFLANTDALIIDLRQNGGGDPAGVQLFCSYLFGAKPVHLNSIYFRNGASGTTTDFWTLKTIDGPRYLNKDVYVLTSKNTGSGAEECAYDLQNLKRATIVGEPTWGGANPGGTVRLNDHFSIFIPSGRAINPYTKTNWEGTGVKPDIAENPTTSLKATQILALKALLAKAKDPDAKQRLEASIKQVAGETSN